MPHSSEWETLQTRAAEARKNAYAPYSGYSVGAAVADADGNIWTGCNVENVSYGLCICAERSALCRMVAEGHRQVVAVAVATKDGGLPCGMCLQSLVEFAEDPGNVAVVSVSDAGVVKAYKLSDLIPHGFTTSELKRT